MNFLRNVCFPITIENSHTAVAKLYAIIWYVFYLLMSLTYLYSY